MEVEVSGTVAGRQRFLLARALHQRLAKGRHSAESCIDAAFRFLLDREPKESILRQFDLAVIERYFPEFERELPRYLAALVPNKDQVGLAYLDATTGELYLDEHGPSLRALYDVADPKKSRFMHSTGQSGLPWSKWYSTFVEDWAKVDYLPLWHDEPPMATLRLEPAR
jgi:hypothetical protein